MKTPRKELQFIIDHMTDESVAKVLDSIQGIESSLANKNSKELSWIEKDRLAGNRLNEMIALASETSILNEISSKILRRLIIEGINIGLTQH